MSFAQDMAACRRQFRRAFRECGWAGVALGVCLLAPATCWVLAVGVYEFWAYGFKEGLP